MTDIDTLIRESDTVPTYPSTCPHQGKGPLKPVASSMPAAVANAQQRALAAKLSLPHQGFVLSRSRLLRRVERLHEGGVVLLVAGPGYGKTAFIVDLLSSSRARTIYYAADEGDRDPVRFLDYILAGLGAAGADHPEAISRDWTLGVSNSDADAVLELTGAVIEQASRQAAIPTILAIDDLHVVESSAAVMEALGLVVRSLPPGWTALLSSRRKLALGLDDVSMGGRIVRLHGRDLRLTPREVAAWARQNWGVVLQPSEARALWRVSEGWPAALVLLGQHLLSRRARIDHEDVIDIMTRGQELRSYLEHHVISDLDPLAAETVLMGSLLPRVVFPRDEQLLPGIPGEAEALLEDFVSRGFLVTRTGRRQFTMHPLLRNFAERELWPREAETGTIKRAAEHLERNGESRDAAYLYLRAGYCADAVRPLRALALSSLNAVLDFARQEWLDLIPEALLDDQPWLLVAKGRVLQHRTEYAEANTLYERAARLLSAANDKEGLLSVLLSSAYCLFSLGRWEESQAVLSRCRNLAGSPAEKTEVLVAQGSVLASLCRWDEAVENYEKALALAPAGMRPTLAPRVHMLRARLFYSLGHYRLAKQWVYRSLASSSGRATPAEAQAMNGAALLEYVTADYEAALSHADKCLRLARSRGYSFLETSALLTRAGVAFSRGDYRGGLTEVRHVQRLAQKAGDAEELFWVEDMLGDFCRRQGSPTKALEHHRKALAIAGENHLSQFERVRASMSIAVDQVAAGRESEGRGPLDDAIVLSRRWALASSLVPALFYLGWVNARSGREHEAARSLAEAMRLAAEHEQIHFLVQEARVAAPILALADRLAAGDRFIREGIVPRLSSRLQAHFSSLAEGPVYPTDVGLGRPRPVADVPGIVTALPGDQLSPDIVQGIEALTDREREVLKMISLGMPNKSIGARLFITEKTVKTHANHVFRKLGVSSRVQAMLAFQSYQRARRRHPGGRPQL